MRCLFLLLSASISLNPLCLLAVTEGEGGEGGELAGGSCGCAGKRDPVMTDTAESSDAITSDIDAASLSTIDDENEAPPVKSSLQQTNVPEKNVLEQNVPKKNVRKKNDLKKNVPQKNVPEKNVPKKNVPKKNMVFIEGGTFFMGSGSPLIPTDGEGPRRLVTLSDFMIDRYEVSNEEYVLFTDSTGYRTDSEVYGWSFVFESAVPPLLKKRITQAVLGAEWWLPVNGSYWREPEGPGTDVFSSRKYRGSLPAVHISWTDAVAYCDWRGARLPTEAEWEYAAQGKGKRKDKHDPKNKVESTYPWGNKLTPKGTFRANIFQGDFPVDNTGEDGFEYLSPVDSFPHQNDYGLHNMIGNAWEWVGDWFTAEHSSAPSVNPTGPTTGRDRVKKGGSFLCHRSFCYRYRHVARYPSTPDSATQNSGFRCAMSGGGGERGWDGDEDEL